MARLDNWWDYVEDAVTKSRGSYHILPIAITSQAEGAKPSDGWATGQGKSTVACQVAKKIWMDFYGYDEWTAEEMVKKFMIGNWDDYKTTIDYGMNEARVAVAIAEDKDEWAGKHVSHSKPVQWAARNFIRYRPYLGVYLATMSHIGELAASWRSKWMFEIKVYTLGHYEIQYIKTKTNFGKPHDPYQIMDKNTVEPRIGVFAPMSKDFQKWYDDWRHNTTHASFKAGWEKHFGEDNVPNVVPEAMTSMNRFSEAVRGIGIKASEEKLRELYNEFIKPTVKLTV